MYTGRIKKKASPSQDLEDSISTSPRVCDNLAVFQKSTPYCNNFRISVSRSFSAMTQVGNGKNVVDVGLRRPNVVLNCMAFRCHFTIPIFHLFLVLFSWFFTDLHCRWCWWSACWGHGHTLLRTFQSTQYENCSDIKGLFIWPWLTGIAQLRRSR